MATMFVSANYFKTIGVALARGTGIRSTRWTSRLTAEPVVILGYQFWQNQLGSDPDIVGKTLTLDDVPHVVVGIAPDQFDGHLFLHGKELFVPLERHPLLRDRNQREPSSFRSRATSGYSPSTAACRPESACAQASAAVSAVTSQLAKQYPATNEFKAGIVAAYHPIGSLAAFAVPGRFRPSR